MVDAKIMESLQGCNITSESLKKGDIVMKQMAEATDGEYMTYLENHAPLDKLQEAIELHAKKRVQESSLDIFAHFFVPELDVLEKETDNIVQAQTALQNAFAKIFILKYFGDNGHFDFTSFITNIEKVKNRAEMKVQLQAEIKAGHKSAINTKDFDRQFA